MWLIKELEPVKDRFLCFVPGNHEGRSQKDDDVHLVEDIAVALLGVDKAKELYREDGAFLKLSFGKKHNGKKATYGIFLSHGAGGGKRPGSALNNIELMSMCIEGLDLIIAGHVHKKIGYEYQKVTMDMYNNLLRLRPVKCVIAAPWQYYGGYGMKKFLTPSAKGATPCILHGKMKKIEAII